ncbi:DUF2381 family protein [Pyxidicoccus sp. QH1ED-7-1]|nr:DUF2381 family protein [Pyxidicoccus xibeiensis]
MGPLEGVRRIELRGDLVSPLPEVHIAPGLSTTVFFDSRIHPDSVKLEGRERFHRLGIADDSLALIPSETFRPGERVRLEVRFREGGHPERAAVMLVVDAARVDRQVEFFRNPRTPEACRQEVEELKLTIQQQQRELERLRASKARPGDIEALIASVEGSDPFRIKTLSYQRVISPSRFAISNAKVVTMASRLQALRLQVSLREQGADWTAVGASLVDAQGRAVRVRSPWQREPLKPEMSRSVVVVLEDASPLRKGRYTLKLWDEGGGRSMTIEGLEVH